MSKGNQKRPPPARPAAPRTSALQWWPIAAAAIIVTAAIWLLSAHLRSAGGTAPTPAPSVFPSVHYPSQGHQGHAPGDAKRFANFQYSSDPPTSGFHQEVFSKGFIDDNPLPKYVQVHLLEHGNILLQYNCLCPETVSALTDVANEFNSRLLPQGVISPSAQQIQQAEENGFAVVVAPYPAMKYKIALTAWTRLATMDTVNKADVVSFINRWLHDSDNLSQ